MEAEEEEEALLTHSSSSNELPEFAERVGDAGPDLRVFMFSRSIVHDHGRFPNRQWCSRRPGLPSIQLYSTVLEQQVRVVLVPDSAGVVCDHSEPHLFFPGLSII